MASTQTDIRLTNLDCEHDAANLERRLGAVRGVERMQVFPKAAKVRLTFDNAVVDLPTIKAQLNEIGFPVQDTRESPPAVRPWQDPKVVTSALSGLILLVVWLADRAGAADALTLSGYLASALLGGYFFGREALEELLFERKIGIELLMAVAAVAAIVLGAAEEGAMLAFLYSISEAAEGYTEAKTRGAIRALMDLTPKRAIVRRNGVETEIAAEDIQLDDVFLVKPGEAIATDGVVIDGSSDVNQAPVTGESVPVDKQPGANVFAGSINGEGALEVRATKTFANNTIARIIELVEDAQEKKGTSQRFIERFGSRYSPLVLLAGLLLAIVPSLLGATTWREAIARATVFIVAAAPCALVISIPITLVASLGTGARNGVLIKGGLFVEELAKVRVVALDKTGTLTRGEPEVTAVHVFDGVGMSETELVRLATGVEARSQHPLARAIVSHAARLGIASPAASAFRSLTGAGATATVEGRQVYVAKPEFFQRALNDRAEVQRLISDLQVEGNTVVVCGTEHEPWGLIAIRDTLRPNARQAVADLRKAGIRRIVMLTGDNLQTGEAIGRQAGVDEVLADLSPEDKATRVRELSTKYGHVAMVGDGVNDAPALAQATVGVAMGAAGTDVALETADVALMADDLEKLVYALRLAQRNERVVRQNLGLSVLVIGVLVVGALIGWFSLPIAVIGHEVSEFVVIGSGLRMLRT